MGKRKKAMKQSTMLRLLTLVGVTMLAVTMGLMGFANMYGKIVKINTESKEQLIWGIETFMDGSRNLTAAARRYVVTGDEQYRQKYYDEVNNAKNREAGEAAMQKGGLEPEEEGYLKEIFVASDNLVPLEENAMKYVDLGDKDSGIDLLYGDKYVDGLKVINDTEMKLYKSIEVRCDARIESASKKEDVFNLLSFVSVVIGIITQALSVVVVGKYVIAPMKKVEDAMGVLAKGDLKVDVGLPVDETEIGHLAASIEGLRDMLNLSIMDIDRVLSSVADGDLCVKSSVEYVGDLKNIDLSLSKILHDLGVMMQELKVIAQQIRMGASQLSEGAQMLSEGAVKQTGDLDSLVADLRNIGLSVDKSKEFAVNASDYVDMAGADMEAAGEAMNELAGAMDNIERSSQEISKIVKAIDEIAFQTNILALNAAVEAARAGEAGRGFAVVADEVRNLASKSAEAVGETTKLIEAALEAAKGGVDKTEAMGAAMGAVGEKAMSTKQVVQKIVDLTELQVSDMNRINDAVSSISSVVHSNAASAEQLAATSEELSAQSEMLDTKVQRFKTDCKF